LRVTTNCYTNCLNKTFIDLSDFKN